MKNINIKKVFYQKLITVTVLIFVCSSMIAQNATTQKHYIGELYGGGIVFWTDSTGNHGLIASSEDISGPYVWSNVVLVIGKKAQSKTDGRSNTKAIIAQKGHKNSAAKICVEYSAGGFKDWYLPSIEELKLLFSARKILRKKFGDNVLTIDYYWSSTEDEIHGAWYWSFCAGDPIYTNKEFKIKVRAIRAF